MNDVARPGNPRRLAAYLTFALSLPVVAGIAYAVFSSWMLVEYGPEATVFFPKRGHRDGDIPAVLGVIIGLLFAAAGAYTVRSLRRRLLRRADVGDANPPDRAG